MGITEDTYYSKQFIDGKDDKTYVLFHDPEGNLMTECEIPRQDITEAIRLNGENN